jgi:hypothetical protein
MKIKYRKRYVMCCGKKHEIIQFTYKGPIQWGVECSVCGRRVADETSALVREKFNEKKEVVMILQQGVFK